MAKLNMELLAPAGGEEQLDYAIRFGADAVYLACERFGMRARSANFALDDLARIVGKAHDHGVKVHVACNVMMHEEDIEQLPEFFRKVESAGADALIIGDLGAAALAREHAPNVELHVSTQASVCNAQTAKVWHVLGAKRVVAAREMSLAEIASMKRQMPEGMELEVFAHGAMCMAYSGRCLISDYLNGRSGIRGNCSQSCRWKYALVEEWRQGKYLPVEEDGKSSYILNADDLCMIEHLEDLAAAGVDSIKIEGRNKKAYYVACVINAYRQVLDGACPADFLRELDCVSHRPYTTGFYYGPAHQTPENLIYYRNTAWAAQVISCEQMENGLYSIEFRCRDSFALEDSFEVVSPHEPVRPIRFLEARYIPFSRYDDPSRKIPKNWSEERERIYAVDEVNHPGERYFATVDVRVCENDIIRVLR